MAAPAQPSLSIAIRGPLSHEDLPGLVARTCEVLAGGRGGVLRCELGDVAADAVSVDALARLALAARRRSCSVLLCGASLELRSLVALVGLGEVLRAEPPAPPSPSVPPAPERGALRRPAPRPG
jgi:ABC-type transporter Mla MlaB component